MSRTIDQKVVEMRFDNKQFETNARQSMSTLEKLKAKLNFRGASKGLENINSTANKINMRGLSNALDTVNTRFSALEVMGVTALANITNSAVNAGKRIASALTIDPVMTGFKEYETQIGAIQTILANTQKEGTNVEIVNKALDELNEYADQTIYNFTEMTRNIGTFTAAGVKLDDSVAAIKGIANLAAVSGSTSQQASTAMYQLSQALAAGKVQLMDWNSVVNAGMGGQVFQDALTRTSEMLGTGAEKAIKKYGSFRESLTKSGWLTTEVLNETLKQLAGTYDKAELIAQGFTEKQADEIVKLAQTAKAAATEVKTFTQLWDVMKEAAQSGWSQTWRLIIGDFEDAKKLLSPIAEFFTGENGIITKMSNARNTLIKGALYFNPFTSMLEKLENSSIGKVAKKIDGISKSLETYQDITNKVWRGDYNNRGDNPDRYDLLRKDGFNPQVVQNLVNKGYQYKLTVDDVRKAEEKYGVTVTETTHKLEGLTDAQLREIGLTEEEIRMYRELEKQSKKTGKSIQELIGEMSKKSGRELLIESLANIGKGLVKIFKSIGEAWRNAFPPMTSIQLYNIIAGFNSFTKKLVMSDDTAKDLTRTLKGVFAILDLISMVIGTGFRIAFTVLKAVLSAFNLDILEFTAILGDAIVKFRDWIEDHNLLAIVVTKSVKLIFKLGKAIANLAVKLWNLPAVQKFIEPIAESLSKIGDITLKDVISALKSFGKAIKNVFLNINEHFNGVPGDIIMGLYNGIKNGIKKVLSVIAELAKKLITKFQDLLGIKSPSRVFFAIGGFIIAGLIGGLLTGNTELGKAAGGIVEKLKGFFENVNWSKLFSAGVTVGLLAAVLKISSAIFNVSKMFSGLGGIFDSVSSIMDDSSKHIGKILKNTAKVVKNFSKVLGAIAFKKSTEGIKNLGITLLMLVGAIAILTLLDPAEMWEAVKIVAALAGILVALSLAVGLLSKASVSVSKDGIKMSGLQSVLTGIGAALLMMALVVKITGGMNPEQYKQGAQALLQLSIGLFALVAALTIVSGIALKGPAAENIHKVGKMASKIAFALLLMVGVVKLASKLTNDELTQAAKFATGFGIFMLALGGAALLGGNSITKLGGMVFKLSVALMLLIGVIKMVALLTDDELEQAGDFAKGVGIFMLALGGAALLGGDALTKLGGTLLAIATSMGIIALVIKLLGGMDPDVLKQGAKAVVQLSILVGLLMVAVSIFGADAPKLAGSLLAIAGAIGILAVIAVVLGLVDDTQLTKGLAAVSVLGVIMAVLIGVTKLANEKVVGVLVTLTVAIGVMATAIGLLSLIKPEKLIAPTLAMAALMGMFMLLMKSTKNVAGSMGCLITITVMVGILSLALGLIALLPWKNTLGAAVGLSLLIATMAGVLTLLSKLKPVGMQALQGALSLSAVLIPLLGLAGILYLMKGVNNAVSSAVALSVLLVSMSGILKILSTIGPMASASYPAMGALAVLIVGLGVIMGALGALMKYVPALEDFLNHGIVVLEKIGYALGSFFGNIVGGFLGGVTSGLPEMAKDLSDFMEGLEPFIKGAKEIDKAAMDGVKALAETVLILTAANVLDGISKLLGADNSLADFGDEIADFGESLQEFEKATKDIDAEHVKKAAEATKALVEIADAVPNSGGLLGKITGENDLGDFGEEISEYGEELAEFSESIKNLSQDDVDKVRLSAQAAQEMIKVAKEVPNSGGLVAMITGENSLADFGDEMEDFGDELAKYSENIQGINPDLIKKSGTATKELISMVKTFDGGLIDKLTGEHNLGSFAAGLVTFGQNLVKYSKEVVDLNTESILVSIDAATGLVQLAHALNPEGGWLQGITGTKDLANFAKDLSEFGPSLVDYSKSVVNLDGKSIKNSVDAAEGVVSLAVVLNRSQQMSLTSGFATFIKELVPFGTHLRLYSYTVNGMNNKAIESSAEGVKNVAVIASMLNKSQEDTQAISGFVTFARNLVTFGTNLRLYSYAVNGINNEAIASSAKGAKHLTDVLHSLPESSGLKSIFTGGGKNLASFASQLVPFGYGMKAYANAVAGISIEDIKTSRDAATEIIGIYDLLPDKKGVFDSLLKGKQGNFASKLVPIAESLKKYATTASQIDVEAILSSEEAFKAIRRMLANVGDIDVDKIESFNSAVSALDGLNIDNFAKAFNDTGGKLTTAGTNLVINLVKGVRAKQKDVMAAFNSIIDRMINAISNGSLKARFVNVGSTLLTYMSTGIKLGTNKILSAIKSLLQTANKAIKESYNNFYNSGKYVVDGFASGIKANAYKAKLASTTMAKESLKAARKALGIESPSKEFYAVGGFAGEGFINALVDNADKTYSAGYDMADSARKGLSKAISKVADVINSDMDTQPTIRPVLDLTDIRNGASSINSMFNSTPTMGVMSNLSAISSGMNAARQNGVNSDVVSAIDNLRKDLGNVGGNTYNVNGVAYADTDTDINNAVRTLVRAAKVERRI
jgi:tape measure domain-containing protein